jgi:hypothetical protein
MNKKKSVNYWIELYLQAKIDGDLSLMEAYKKVILSLGGKIPK